MNERNFGDRANVQQIAEFILHGVELAEEPDPDSYEVRQHKNDREFIKSLHDYRRRIVEVDWSKVQGEQCIALDEEMYSDAGVLEYYQKAINLAFEMGLIAGMKIRSK